MCLREENFRTLVLLINYIIIIEADLSNYAVLKTINRKAFTMNVCLNPYIHLSSKGMINIVHLFESMYLPTFGCFIANSCKISYFIQSRISGVMISVLASSAVDRGFEPRSGQTKDYKIGICYFFANHPALRRKNKD